MKTLKKTWNWFGSKSSIIAFLILFIFASIAFSEKNLMSFPSIMRLFNKAASDTGIAALGMAFVIMIGQIDLSVGAVLALSGVIMGIFGQTNPILGIVLGLMCGAITGLLNGLMVTKLRISSWIATLAMLMGVRGLVLLITNKSPVSIKDPILRAIGGYRIPFLNNTNIPILVVIFVVLTLICMHISHNTKFGTSLYAVGGNEEAARMMGLPVDRTKILAFVACGVIAALSGILSASKLGTAQPNAGDAWETTAIAMCALGGIKLSGGEGKFSGAFFGAMIITIINTIFNYSGKLDSAWQRVAMGGVILLSIALQSEVFSFMKKNKEEVKEEFNT